MQKNQNRLWPWWDNSALSCCSYQTSSALARARKQRYCNAWNWGCPSDLPTKVSVILKTNLLLKMKHLSASVYTCTPNVRLNNILDTNIRVYLCIHMHKHTTLGGGEKIWTLKWLKCQLLTPTGWKITLNAGHTFQSSFLFWLSRDSFTQHCRCYGWVTLKYKMFWKKVQSWQPYFCSKWFSKYNWELKRKNKKNCVRLGRVW